MENEFKDFTVPDELSSLIFKVEGQLLYVHKEILAAWSPVFKVMFTQDFKEKDQNLIELPGKQINEFIELLHCIYPPIKSITDQNVFQLLPLVDEYQILGVKKRCEDFLLTKPGSMELLIIGQQFNLHQLINKCIDAVRVKNFSELQKDPVYHKLEPDNLINILQMRVLDLEVAIDLNRKLWTERDARIFGIINDLASGYGNFCPECKSRKVSETCSNCLRMYRDKVKSKCDEAKQYRIQNSQLFSNIPCAGTPHRISESKD